MSLLHSYLPEHQLSERHLIRVIAPPARELDMASQLHVTDFPVARLLLYLRAIPARIAAALGKPSARRIDARFGLHDFTVLGRDGEQEFALGLVGRFWESAGGLIHVEASAFRTFSEPDIAKLVMTFVARPEGADTLLTTRTCVHCSSTTALRRFTPYWILIRMPSGLIRRMMLQRIKQLAEADDAPLTRPE